MKRNMTGVHEMYNFEIKRIICYRNNFNHCNNLDVLYY